MQMRRAPTRSVHGPDRAFSTTYGAISAKATSPVCTALPVVVSTSQGIAIIETRVPVSDTASEARKPQSAPRPLTTDPPRRRRAVRVAGTRGR